MPKERKTQYVTGYDDAIEQVMLLFTVGIDTYPRSPSEVTLSRIMEVDTARKLLEVLDQFHERVARDLSQIAKDAARGNAI